MIWPVPLTVAIRSCWAAFPVATAVTLLRLGVTPKNADAIVNYLKAGQRKDGAYCKEDSTNSDLESTYRVMRAFVMLKAKPLNIAGLRDFIQKCRNAGEAPLLPLCLRRLAGREQLCDFTFGFH